MRLGSGSAATASLVVLLALAIAPAAHASVLPTGFQDTEVFTGLSEPTKLRFAPDGKVFIALRKGKILVYENLADKTPTTFADLSEMAYDKGDRGILGMALDPKFDEGRPYVYVLYTYNHILGDPAPAPKYVGKSTEGDPCPPLEEVPEGETPGANDCLVSGRLVRLTAEGEHAKETAGKPFEEVLVEDWCQQFDSHSIGDLQFDSEGNLYASAGEGASYDSPDYGQFGLPKPNECGDPPGKAGEALKVPTAEGGSLRSQNSKNLDGKVIRVDPNTGKGLPGNPLFASGNANEQRILAKGFRNPFRFTIDPVTHEVYVGNVGWNTWEEIDRFAAPLGETPGQLYNSGWPCYEGPEETQGFDTAGLDVCEALYKSPGSTSPPFYAYEHGVPLTPEDPCETIYGSVLNGIAFYGGSAFPAPYKGALFFADGARQCIYVMFPGEDGRPDPSTVRPFLTFGGLYPTAVDIEEGPEGNLFYINLFGPNFDSTKGTVHRISYSSTNQPPVARLSVDKEFGAAPLLAHFDASASSDADGEALAYEWDLEDNGNFVKGSSTATKTFSDKENHTVTVRVTDKKSATSVARVTVYPGDTPPEPKILAPSESLAWHVGQQIHFEGSASDAEQGSLLPPGLDWDSRIKHCPSSCHVHPLQAFPSVASGTLVAPEHDYPSGIELTLTATDSRGLAASKTVVLSPEAVELNMQSNPSGVELTSGLVSKPAPFTVTAITGSHLTLSAPQTFKAGETTYAFKAWSDAGERVHTIVASGSATYTAEYAAPKASLASSQHWSGAGGLEVQFDASGSTGEGLQYEWDPEGDGTYEAASATATKTIAIADEAAHKVKVRVKDSRGATSVAEKTVKALAQQIHSNPTGLPLQAATVSKTAPFTIYALEGSSLQLSAPEESPLGGSTYLFSSWSDAGARVHSITASAAATYTATYVKSTPVVANLTTASHYASGALQADLDASTSSGKAPLSYEWDPEGDGTFEAPTATATKSIAVTDEAAHKVTVRVSDATGGQATASTTLQAVGLTLKSNPTGISLSAAGQSKAAPFTLLALKGTEVALSAPASAKVGESTYAFKAWSDAGAREHKVTANAPTTYSAEYSVPTANLTTASHYASGALQADLDASTSSGKAPLSYEWDPEGDGTFEAPTATATKSIAVTDEAAHKVTVRVSDATGGQATASTTLQAVGLTLKSNPTGISLSAAGQSKAAPFTLLALKGTEVALSAPASAKVGESTYAFKAWSDAGAREHKVTANAPTTYSAEYSVPTANLTTASHYASGALQADLDASTSSGKAPLSYEWDPEGDGTFEAPTATATKSIAVTDEAAHKVTVRVSDATGGQATASTTLQAVGLTLKSNPTGISLSAAGQSKAAPFTLLALKGTEVALSAPASAKVGESTYAFKAWSDAGAREHKVTANAPTTYSAEYSVPTANLTTASHYASGALQADLDASTSSGKAPLSYEWDPEGDGTFEAPTATATKSIAVTDEAAHKVTVRVSDATGGQATASTTLQAVGLTLKSNPTGISLSAAGQSKAAPFTLLALKGTEVALSAPASAKVGESTYAFKAWSDAGAREHKVTANAPTTYSAEYSVPTANLTTASHYASGALQADLDASTSSGKAPLSYEWDPEGDGTFEAPTATATKSIAVTDEAAHKVTVRVSDATGGQATASTTLQAVGLTLKSNPTGISLSAAGQSKAAPFTLLALKGTEVALSAPQEFEPGGTPYFFTSWSDAGARTHTIAANTPAVYTATYDTIPPPPKAQLGSPSEHWSGAGVLEVQFDASPSSGEGLQYEWDPEGNGTYEAASAVATKTIAIADEAAHKVSVRVKDAYGVTDTAEKTVKALAQQIHSNPTGLPLQAATVSKTAPFTIYALEGSSLQLSAPEESPLGGSTYLFSSWSDAGARVHSITASAAATYTATYEEERGEEGPGEEPPPTGLEMPHLDAVVVPPLIVPQVDLEDRPAKRSPNSIARFVFSADNPLARFRCKLDRGSFQDCRSPRVFRHLKPGWHVFGVLAYFEGSKIEAPGLPMEGPGVTRAAARLVVLLACGAVAVPAAHASVLPTGFQDTEVFTGLSEPTKLRFAPDGKVFIALRKGKILVYENLADKTPTTFADLSEMAYDKGDRGILGMALDPKFDEGRPYVYVLYTYNHILGDPAPAPKYVGKSTEGDPCPPLEEVPEGETPGANDCLVSGRLVRLTAEGEHAKETAGKPFEEVLVEDWCQQFDSHSIGDLQFDSEGNLYASAGEGASYDSPDYGQFGLPKPNECGDPPGKAGEALKVPTAEGGSLRSQNSKNLDGKVIRVDPNTGKGLPGNPLFASGNANEQRILAKGFRNPFRFTIDPVTHEVYVGNVGWNTWEEIDRFAAPLGETPGQLYNSGWPCYEGPEETQGFDTAGLDVCEALYKSPGSTSPPFYAYEHGVPLTPEDPCETIYGSVLNGIAFYGGSAFPAPYKGALFFADGARQCIYVMFPGEDGRPDPSTVRPFLTFGGLYPTAVDIEEGPEGNLFYINLFGPNFDSTKGTVHRISYSSTNQPPVARLSVDKEFGAAPLLAHFDASASSDADGEALAYEWDLEDNGNFVKGSSTATKTFSDKENHTVTVRVTDKKSATSVARVTVYPGDTPPEPKILAPSESLAWHVGQQIHFEGSASDAEQGSLLPPGLDWDSRIKHCPSSCHVHPLQAFPSVASGTLVAPEHDYPSGIELTLTATDSRGLAASKTVVLSPEAVELHLGSCPSGVTITAGLLSASTPFSATVIKGSHLTLLAPATVQNGQATLPWTEWSDGGARVHTVTVNASATYTASYAGASCAESLSGGGGERPPTELGPATRPRTTLRAHPPKRTHSSKARFRFGSSQAGSRFRCKLDGQPYRFCGATKVFKHLKPGRHTLRVEAIGGNGAADRSPAKFSWTVL